MYVISYCYRADLIEYDNIQIPGHTGSWCWGYPEICPNPSCNTPNKNGGDSPDGILNPATNTTYEMIEGLFNEAITVFMDDYFHIGLYTLFYIIGTCDHNIM